MLLPLYKTLVLSRSLSSFLFTTIMLFFFLLAFVCSLSSLVLAIPIHPRDVWVPPITYPVAGTVWAPGGTYNVTWDTTSKPTNVTNSQGMVYLRIGNATQSTPLAQGFPLTAGVVNVTIPAGTQPSTEWMVVRKLISHRIQSEANLALCFPVFGDSGNWSPPFTIS